MWGGLCATCREYKVEGEKVVDDEKTGEKRAKRWMRKYDLLRASLMKQPILDAAGVATPVDPHKDIIDDYDPTEDALELIFCKQCGRMVVQKVSTTEKAGAGLDVCFLCAMENRALSRADVDDGEDEMPF